MLWPGFKCSRSNQNQAFLWNSFSLTTGPVLSRHSVAKSCVALFCKIVAAILRGKELFLLYLLLALCITNTTILMMISESELGALQPTHAHQWLLYIDMKGNTPARTNKLFPIMSGYVWVQNTHNIPSAIVRFRPWAPSIARLALLNKSSCLLPTSCNTDLRRGPWESQASTRHQLHSCLQHMSAKQFANGFLLTHDHIWQKGARLFAAIPIFTEKFSGFGRVCTCTLSK